jgi:hypothetical protein
LGAFAVGDDRNLPGKPVGIDVSIAEESRSGLSSSTCPMRGSVAKSSDG